MSTAQELQSLLRFLTQDAKVPLAVALAKSRDLQRIHLHSPQAIAKSDIATIQTIFPEEKMAKQVLNAAKRLSKKRPADFDGSGTDVSIKAPAKKRSRPFGEPMTPAELEDSLILPTPCLDVENLSTATLYTNRAPLVLAFAVTLLKYTMPEQPLSSRLSLAQALVSANSRTKAVSVGLESGKSAEEEGFGEGQPVVTIMGRDIKVMKRWGYHWQPETQKKAESRASELRGDATTQDTLQSEQTLPLTHEDMPALWGIDLDALKKSKTSNSGELDFHGQGNLPIYTAQSARSYLLKSFDSPPDESSGASTSQKKKPAATKNSEKERNLGLLLGALELLFNSWGQKLDKTDIDKRAWTWYVKIRPAVESGAAGWGGKNTVKLSTILDLRWSEQKV